MREIIPLEHGRTQARLAPDVDAALRETQDFIASRSQLLWGEHCSECAAPSCYAACDFYTPRADGHCRRFEGGMLAHDVEGLGPSAALEIRFRRWGKLEANGPAKPVSKDTARRREKAAATLETLAGDWSVTPVARRFAWVMNRVLRGRGADRARQFEGVLIEGMSLDGAVRNFTLSLSPLDKRAVGLFQTAIQLTPDWSRHFIPIADIAGSLDLDLPRLISLEPVGEAAGIHVLFGFCDLVTLTPAGRAAFMPKAPPPSRVEKRAKVVVWDLDHTLWDGTLAEDGIEGLTLKPKVRELIKELDARGVLQSVASKNDAGEAQAALRHFELDSYFLTPQASWGPKSQALHTIAKHLNLGLDSFVFVDDQVFEREEVAAGCPGVVTRDARLIDQLLADPLFDLHVTPESRKRRKLYRLEADRAVAAATFGGDGYEAFLRDCRLEITLERLSEANLERVFELSQRTNQLNIAATRFLREDLVQLMRDAAREVLAVRCQDRFGDYGLIGAVVWAPERGEINDFFMSCRVQRKKVEAALTAWLVQEARAKGAKRLSVRWRKATRNGAAAELFLALGFHWRKESDAAGFLLHDLAAPIDGAEIVAVRDARELSSPVP